MHFNLHRGNKIRQSVIIIVIKQKRNLKWKIQIRANSWFTMNNLFEKLFVQIAEFSDLFATGSYSQSSAINNSLFEDRS